MKYATLAGALAALGETENEVAEKLVEGRYKERAQRVLGICGDCPVAMYLQDVWNPDARCGLTHAWSGSYPSTRLPEPVRRFIENFDQGRWPNLRRESPL